MTVLSKVEQGALQLGSRARRLETPIGWHLEDWSDFELRLAIDFEPFTVVRRAGKRKGESFTIGPVFSWKRSRKVITIKGRSSIGQTTEAQHWAKAAAARLAQQWLCIRAPIPSHVEINAAIVSHLPTRRLIDSSNLYQGPEDVLQAHRPGCKEKCRQHAGVLEDDASLRTHWGSDRLYDPERPRVVITLIPYWRRYDAVTQPNRRPPCR